MSQSMTIFRQNAERSQSTCVSPLAPRRFMPLHLSNDNLCCSQNLFWKSDPSCSLFLEILLRYRSQAHFAQQILAKIHQGGYRRQLALEIEQDGSES